MEDVSIFDLNTFWPKHFYICVFQVSNILSWFRQKTSDFDLQADFPKSVRDVRPSLAQYWAYNHISDAKNKVVVVS